MNCSQVPEKPRTLAVQPPSPLATHWQSLHGVFLQPCQEPLFLLEETIWIANRTVYHCFSFVFEMEPPSVALAGVQWYNLGLSQLPPPGFK